MLRLHGAAGGLGRLPTSILRTICQQLSHADIEQCRLVCTEWRTAFGEASVTDMYLVRPAGSAQSTLAAAHAAWATSGAFLACNLGLDFM